MLFNIIYLSISAWKIKTDCFKHNDLYGKILFEKTLIQLDT
jgi:hypothetical protein